MALRTTELRDRLDHYYQQVRAIVLTHQNLITGLLPASTAVSFKVHLPFHCSSQVGREPEKLGQ